jgi:diguanylate cyclase (GGDEF)-like protein
MIDKLTGLPNRAKCDQLISNYGNNKLPNDLVCICFDLNNIKIINDTYGHSAGDRLIQDFGQILKEISEGYGFVGRNGGDEFIAFFENTKLEIIDKYIENLNSKIDVYNNTYNNNIKIEYAYGAVSSNSYKVNSVFNMLNLAGRSMYDNKHKNKEFYLNNEDGSNVNSQVP